MKNNNGFVDMLKQTKQLLNVNDRVTLEVLEEAAEYFAAKLRPRIPVSKRNKWHLREKLKVVIKKDMVQVVFEDVGWYWHLVEHGHKKPYGRGRVKGQHFVRDTWVSERKKIEEIMLNKIFKKMGA